MARYVKEKIAKKAFKADQKKVTQLPSPDILVIL